MILAFSAILGLIANPACGNVSPVDQKQTQHVFATAIGESGGDPYIIGVNADRTRGLPAEQIRSNSADEAAAKALTLLAEGRRIDLGLFQISSGQIERHHLTVTMAFDPCANTAAAVQHLADDYQAVTWELAHRRYNCGRSDCGIAYGQKISALANTAPVSAEATTVPAPPPTQPCAPEWDGWALVACNTLKDETE